MGEYGKKSLLITPEKIIFGTNTVEDLGVYACISPGRAKNVQESGRLPANGLFVSAPPGNQEQRRQIPRLSISMLKPKT